MATKKQKWNSNYVKPKNVTISCLFSIELFFNNKYVVVRDCTYLKNIFTQIDDKNEYFRFDILLWKKQ